MSCSRSCTVCIFQDGTKHTQHNTHVFFMFTVIIRADCFQRIDIKRRVRVLQVVRCTPIVFNTSFASGPVVRANVFCSLINLQKKASAAFGV